ncbi:right-handed parallel beta-helix repeat-containing protein [Brevundimonas sp.]|uniref:right-handed parallel beta-helix repeat-containing protein n=1 Tax=Brevundimonas sp. TaxID=1871086 RepID=UPI0035B33F70
MTVGAGSLGVGSAALGLADIPPSRPEGAGTQISLAAAASDDRDVDSTAALQRLINNHPSFAVLNGEGRVYRISRPLEIPAGSRMLTIENIQLIVAGDHAAIRHADRGPPIAFFQLRKCLIDTTSHRTRGQAAVDFSNMFSFSFERIWVVGAPGVTVGFYGRGGSGSAPYYGVFDRCYVAGVSIGIALSDAEGALQSVNSLTVRDCRIQPGQGNTGIYIGRNSQNIRVNDTTIESFGGIGIHLAGHACMISGNRFEALDVGVAYHPDAHSNVEIGNYFDSNRQNRDGFSPTATNSIIHDRTGADIQQSHLAGALTVVDGLSVGGEAVVGARRGGWALPTGRSSRASFNSSTVTTPELAERVKALIEDLHADRGHGLIGR